MSIVKLTKSPFDAIERTFGQWMDTFEREFRLPRLNQPDLYVPNVDISEDKDNFFIIAELPGLEQKDVKVEIEDGVLTIQGRKERHEEKKERNYHQIERSFGEFTRSMTIPYNVKENAITANFTKGLLELTLPKKVVESSAREIPLNSKG